MAQPEHNNIFMSRNYCCHSLVYSYLIPTVIHY